MTMRVNMTIDEKVLKKVKSRAGKLGVSGWFTEAAREKIEREEREKAWKEILAAPPAFTNIPDSVAWVRELRKADEERDKRLGLI